MAPRFLPHFLPHFLEDLNEQQREAVTAPDGPRLVLAGAGSGKTRVIVYRMAYLIEARGVAPDTLLAVTFTNRAADEMRSRVRAILRSGKDAAVHTFHALCLRLLRRFSEDIGLRSGFTLYGNDERKSLLGRICRDQGIAEREFPLSRIASSVSAHKLRTFDGRGGGDSRFQRLLEAIAFRYQKELDAQGAVDFDDLLLRAVELMECSERAQTFAERRFQHVLVDEYQDTNRIQYRLLRLLAPHKNIFVVGDDDQSIYNFRGADMRNILDFETDFPNATTLKLEINYRSSGAILRAASAVIENNRSRKGKRLIASHDEGLRPELYSAEDDRAEAAHVARRLDELRKQNDSEDAAILLRTHAQTRVFEEELLARGIPHRVLGGLRFYDRKEIKDALGYARLVLNRHDDASFLRVANMPIRGVGKASITIVRQIAEKAGSSLWDASLQALNGELLTGDILTGRARVGLTQFREVVNKLAEASRDETPSRVLRRVFSETGLAKEFEREGEAVARERKENLDQLVAAATEYEAGPSPTLAGFLDSVSLLTDMDAVGSTPCLLMTLHAAKGLEFDTVFLAGLEEGLFPHIRASGDVHGLEEERRLFYVGMTRAKRRLYLSFALSRRFSYQTSARRPSRFLTEIPDADLVTPSGAQTRTVDRSGEAGPLQRGAVVFHAKFGEGKVLDASGSGPDRRVTVLFHKAGRKRLVAQYAKLQVVG